MSAYHVEFPGLGLNFDISPVAFEVGSFSVYWYGIIIAVGFVIAVVYGMRAASFHKINEDKLLNCTITGLITAIIGARTYYVVFSWENFKDNPINIFNIHGGGLAIYGGLIGALIGGLTAAKIQKMKLMPILDVAVIGFLIGQGIGRWGNFTNQEAFGTATNMPWRMVSENTSGVGVHPCFLYESLWCLTGVLVLHIIRTKYQKYDGQIFYLYLVWYGFERMIVEGLRTDSLYLPFGNIRVSQLLSFILFMSGIIMLIIKRKNRELSRALIAAENKNK